MYEENEEKTAKLSKTSKIVFSVLGAAIVIALSIPVIYYILAGIYDILSPIVTYVISTFSYIFIRPFNVPRGELGAWGNYYMYCKWFIPACMVWLITWRIHWFFRVPGIIFSSSFLVKQLSNL